MSLEFPHWTETGTLAEAARVVRVVNRPNAGNLVDMLHFGRSHSSVNQLAKLPREWFRFAHVCDAAIEVPPTIEGIIRTARDERQFPTRAALPSARSSRMPQDIPYALEIPRMALTKAVGPRKSRGSPSPWRRAISTIRRVTVAPLPSRAPAPAPAWALTDRDEQGDFRMIRIIDGSSKVMRIFIALCMLGMVVLVFGNVVLRYAFKPGSRPRRNSRAGCSCG